MKWYCGKCGCLSGSPKGQNVKCDDGKLHEWEVKEDTDEIEYPIMELNCTCDLVTQLLPYGCNCGGK